ncbi:MAG TPA: ABC transporter ATP-binding protein [Streptosporangiaceae bacterium]|jgi:iron(III) transport system ATP-binding protein|nr:ABC transporter ATP-binding protein [Streptosporangiaceae bacterium]
MSAVELVGLRKSYADVTVLDDFSLRANQGELVTLLGPSGCGKTTTLRCIAGLERPERGEIRIGERLVASAERRVFLPPNRRDIGMVFQSYALWPHMTVFANVAYPLRVRRRDRRERHRAVMEILATVGMERYAHRPVTELSGGQQQRVALARAMVARPAVLLFDEPLSNLDAKLRRSMRSQIRDAHDRSGGTSIYVTHDQEEAITLSDRIVVIRSGAIQQVGTPKEIYTQPATRFVADFIGFENLLSATVSEVRDGSAGVRLMPGAGPVWTSRGITRAPGSRVVLAARADELEIGPLGSPGEVPAAAIPGVIRSRTYTGGRIEYLVDAGGAQVVVRVPEAGAAGGLLDAGSGAWVRFPADAAVLVDDEDAGRAPRAAEPATESVPVQGAP